ncbi:MAG TPA: amidohydrolase family protein [Aldersonia sp.]
MTTIFTADRVLGGRELHAITAGAVLVDGARIGWVGREADLTVAQRESAEVHALGAVTVLPGLIDAHVHLGLDGGAAPVERMMGETDTEQIALMLRSARELLSVGVTTARDLGARGYTDIVVRDAIAAGTARGPRMLTAGAPITVTGGHCWYMGAEADSELELRKIVRRHHKAGVDLIKVMATGGNLTPGSVPWHAQFTEAELAVVVDEAHRLGKRVAAHAHGVEGIRRAVAAGVDTLEHCSFQTSAGLTGGFDPDLADRIAASPTYVSPTCNCRVLEYRSLLPELYVALPDLYRHGVPIVGGTDAGIDQVPHYGYVGGLVNMVSLGMPAEEVLMSATVRAAAALGLADETGQLTPGFTADIIAVGGDPRRDIGALHDLRFVLARGRRFVPDDLPAIEPLRADEMPPLIKEMLAARRASDDSCR